MATETPELIWNEVNCTTGEVIVRPYTAEETAEWLVAQEYNANMRAEREAEVARVEAAKASAIAKLAALGLTPEEISAL